ncbi:MAG: hypothetical protein JRD68_07460 [Deltaproteobacteria bacterium]|nr:hypothetical protein [Deltaproteobacteria bacterium]
MLVLLMKIVILVFFGYIAFDAHKKTRNFLKEAKDQRFNRHVLEARARRERIRSVIYLLVTLAVFATLFFQTIIE